MLDHLLQDQPDPPDGIVSAPFDAGAAVYSPLRGLDSGAVMAARYRAAAKLESITPESDPVLDAALARAAAAPALTGLPEENQGQLLNTPGAVMHARALLSQFDHDFLTDALQIRNFVVAGLIDEARGDRAAVRVKALELLGKISEVSLFTDRVSHAVEGLSESEIDKKIAEKLARLGGVTDLRAKPSVQTAEDVDSVVEEVFSGVSARKTRKTKAPSDE